MQHPVECPARQQCPRGGDQVVLDELRPGRHRVGVAGGQVVDDDHVMALFEKNFRADAADVARAAGDQ